MRCGGVHVSSLSFPFLSPLTYICGVPRPTLCFRAWDAHQDAHIPLHLIRFCSCRPLTLDNHHLLCAAPLYAAPTPLLYATRQALGVTHWLGLFYPLDSSSSLSCNLHFPCRSVDLHSRERTAPLPRAVPPCDRPLAGRRPPQQGK